MMRSYMSHDLGDVGTEGSLQSKQMMAKIDGEMIEQNQFMSRRMGGKKITRNKTTHSLSEFIRSCRGILCKPDDDSHAD